MANARKAAGCADFGLRYRLCESYSGYGEEKANMISSLHYDGAVLSGHDSGFGWGVAYC
jgi:hypothetical protein